MLSLTRKVFRDQCGDRNCVVLDMPDGTRVRLWITAARSSRGEVRVAIDAPREVQISRGELLANPLDCIPDPPKPRPAA